MSEGVWVVHDFVSGKARSKDPAYGGPRRFETVTVVARGRVDSLLRTKTMPERLRILRRLRDDGILVAPQKGGRLQHRVRAHDGSKFRAYVFDCPHPDYVRVAVDRYRR